MQMNFHKMKVCLIVCLSRPLSIPVCLNLRFTEMYCTTVYVLLLVRWIIYTLWQSVVFRQKKSLQKTNIVQESQAKVNKHNWCYWIMEDTKDVEGVMSWCH